MNKVGIISDFVPQFSQSKYENNYMTNQITVIFETF